MSSSLRVDGDDLVGAPVAQDLVDLAQAVLLVAAVGEVDGAQPFAGVLVVDHQPPLRPPGRPWRGPGHGQPARPRAGPAEAAAGRAAGIARFGAIVGGRQSVRCGFVAGISGGTSAFMVLAASRPRLAAAAAAVASRRWHWRPGHSSRCDRRQATRGKADAYPSVSARCLLASAVPATGHCSAADARTGRGQSAPCSPEAAKRRRCRPDVANRSSSRRSKRPPRQPQRSSQQS